MKRSREKLEMDEKYKLYLEKERERDKIRREKRKAEISQRSFLYTLATTLKCTIHLMSWLTKPMDVVEEDEVTKHSQ
ncbi:hypothetical protein J6590_027478 [Homalodisca vitripennis]|nr:hypothetical protein J6590_027478 [Homalodisca vitripennis]